MAEHAEARSCDIWAALDGIPTRAMPRARNTTHNFTYNPFGNTRARILGAITP